MEDNLMRKLSCITAVIVCALAAAPAFAVDSVTINNPADGENVIAGSVWVDATATASSALIWVIQIYLDGVKQTEKVVNNVTSCSIDAAITMSAGNAHHLTVQILQQNGTLIAKSTILPNAVTSSTTISGIDNSASNWIACNGCGGGGGGNPVPVTIVSSPSEDGSAAKFTTVGEGGITGGYGTSYWYAPHTAPGAKISYIKYSFDLYLSTADADVPQAIEFECQQKLQRPDVQLRLAGGVPRQPEQPLAHLRLRRRHGMERLGACADSLQRRRVAHRPRRDLSG